VKVQYNGDGSTVSFAVSFAFWSADDLQVIHRASDGTETVWVRGTHYTVSGGNGSTGTVTVLTSPTDYTPAASETLTIKSNIDDKQNQSLPTGGPLPSAAIEEQLDKIVRMIQQKAEALGRAVGFRLTSQVSGFFLPEPAAGEFIRVNSAGTDYEGVALADISGSIDVTLVGLASGDFLQWNGTAWVNKTASEVLTALGAEPADADIAKTDTAASWTAPQYFTDHTDESASNAVTFDFSAGNILEITLDENITGITLSNMTANGIYEIWFTQAAGGYTVSGWSGVTWHTTGGTAPTMNSTNGAVMIVQLRKNAAGIFGSVQNAG
jgi:hypothetical protein